MKGKNTGAQVWLTIRVRPEEKMRLKELAGIGGLSLSEYVRHRVFGGRPILARTDANMIRELRRLGGLLKHNFETLRQNGASRELWRGQEDLLVLITEKMEAIGRAQDDREED